MHAGATLVNGTYNNVQVQGGSGSNLEVNLTVSGGNSISIDSIVDNRNRNRLC